MKFYCSRAISLALYTFMFVGVLSASAAPASSSSTVSKSDPSTAPVASVKKPQSAVSGPGGTLNFDSYLFIQSWYPEVCFAGKGKDPGTLFCTKISSSEQLRNGLAPVNLRPIKTDPEVGFDVETNDSLSRCSSDKTFRPYALTAETWDCLDKSIPQMTNDSFLSYLWHKSGSCTGLEPEHYFKSFANLSTKITSPPFEKYNGGVMNYEDLANHYTSVGLSQEMFMPLCMSYGYDKTKQYLFAVAMHFDKNFNPIPINAKVLKYLSNSPNANLHQCDFAQPISIRKASQFFAVEDLMAKIKEMYPNPINVGFDVDGTVFDGSSLSQHLYLDCLQNVPPKVAQSESPRIASCITQSVINFDDAGYDKLSIFKSGTIAMIEFHMKRGDKVSFITRRTKGSSPKLPSYLQTSLAKFGTFENVIYTNGNSKTESLRKLGIEVYYGDRDSDIEDSLAAGTMPIRVVNNNPETSRRGINVGILGEYVLNSKSLIIFGND